MLEKRENPKTGEIWQRYNGGVLKIIRVNLALIMPIVECIDVAEVGFCIELKEFMSTRIAIGSYELGFKYYKVSEVEWEQALVKFHAERCGSGSAWAELSKEFKAKLVAKRPPEEAVVREGHVYHHFFDGEVVIVNSIDQNYEDPNILRVSCKHADGRSSSIPYFFFTELIKKGICYGPRLTEVDYTEWEKACNEAERQARKKEEAEVLRKKEEAEVLRKKEEAEVLRKKEEVIGAHLKAIKNELMNSRSYSVDGGCESKCLGPDTTWVYRRHITITLERLVETYGSSTKA